MKTRNTQPVHLGNLRPSLQLAALCTFTTRLVPFFFASVLLLAVNDDDMPRHIDLAVNDDDNDD